MQLTIGRFTKHGDDFRGGIRTLTFKEEVSIVLNLDNRPGRAPDYFVYANTVQIGEAQLGVDERGRPCLAVTLDDPSFQQQVLCALVDKDYGDYRLEWSR